MSEPRFGKTGAFPQGKLAEHDEGELQFGIAGDPEKHLVFVEFGTPVKSMAMTPDQAVSIAASLLKQAEKARG